MSSTANESVFRFPSWRGVSRDQALLDTLTNELHDARAREVVLLREKHELSQRQGMLAEEFEHRLMNSLQLIASLLSLQSRAAPTPEAGVQLEIAARRVAALGRVHRRLHLLDHLEKVDFKQYLQHLCEDLTGLLSQERTGFGIVVECAEVEIPSKFAIPLGFIVNELITNSAKYAQGNITVRFEPAQDGHSLSVVDDGPGLRADFDPASSKGLGMKIVMAFAKQIGGALHVLPGDEGRGGRCAIIFGTSQATANAT